jgi:SAM-dependent methyltransferase
MLRLARNAYLDLRYGRRLLGGVVRSPHFERGYFDAVNTDYDVLTRLFSEIRIEPDDVFVDVGCGKGRTLNWFLSRGYGNKLVGVEINAPLAEFTRRRLQRYRQVEIRSEDAVEHFADATIYYLFNPFDAQAVVQWEAKLAQRVIDRASGRRRDRPVVFYTRCEHLDVFEANPMWKIRRIDLRAYGYLEAAIIEPRDA